MKHLKIIFSVLLLCQVLKFTAQITEAQTIHATVAKVKVSYKAVSQGTINPANSSEIQVIPQATVSLKTTNGISKIHFKIVDKVTNAVIYQVSYLLNSGTVLHENGKKIFENYNNGIIYLSNAEAFTLKPYIYQVQTENDQTDLSTTFSIIQ